MHDFYVHALMWLTVRAFCIYPVFQISSNKWPFKHGLAIEEWINLEHGYGDHAHGLTVVFVSLDGVAAATVRDNQRKYHPHLKVAAIALEGPQAAVLKPLLMQVGLFVYMKVQYFAIKMSIACPWRAFFSPNSFL